MNAPVGSAPPPPCMAQARSVGVCVGIAKGASISTANCFWNSHLTCHGQAYLAVSSVPSVAGEIRVYGMLSSVRGT